jgi:hypothetical protein
MSSFQAIKAVQEKMEYLRQQKNRIPPDISNMEFAKKYERATWERIRAAKGTQRSPLVQSVQPPGSTKSSKRRGQYKHRK